MGSVFPIAGLVFALGIYFHVFMVVFDPKSVAGKRVLVTGATSPIGRQLAYQYARLGARVFLTARSQAPLEQVAGQCQELGAGQVDFAAADLALPGDRERLLAEAVRRLAGLDLLILGHATAAAGLWLGSPANVSGLLADLESGFVSHVDLASRALPALDASRGAIGVVASLAARIPVAALGVRSADEAALLGFFLALRAELRHRGTGVTVTAAVVGPTGDGGEKVGANAVWGLDATVAPRDAADAIVAAVAARQREVCHGTVAWILVLLHKVFPGIVENLVGAEPTLSRLT